MNKEWVTSANKIIKFWIWQILAWILGLPIAISLGIRFSEQLAIILSLFIICHITLIVVYAFKIANFFKYTEGGAVDTLRSMKLALLLDVLFCFTLPILIIFTRVFFWVMYKSKKN